MKLSKQFKQDLSSAFKTLFIVLSISCFCISIGGLLHQLGLEIPNSIGILFISGVLFLSVFAFVVLTLLYILTGILNFISYAIEKDEL